MTPEEIANCYFNCIRAKDIARLMTLYADSASFTLPNGKTFAGREVIRQMHLGVFAAGSPTPSPLAMVSSENAIAVEIAARLPDGNVRHTANFYYLDREGLIERLSVYMRS
jgi:ketosteroid isomerase-like protein